MKYTKLILTAIAICTMGAIIFWASNREAPKEETPPVPPLGEAVEEKPEIPPEPPEEHEEVVVSGAAKVHEIMLAAIEYYSESSKNTGITQQNGILYNAAADIFITPSYLIQRDYLPADYDVENAGILFLSSSHVASVIPSFSEQESSLTIYAVAPFDDGYIIDAKGEDYVQISQEQYERLLAPYNEFHGEIRRITASTEEYGDINKILKEYEQTESDYYIRYGKRNDKYAVVIASPKNEYSKIKMDVFVLRDGVWEIKAPNLETMERSKVVICGICPDFDIELMPPYDLYDSLKYMTDDFDGVTEALVADGYLAEGDIEREYISKNNEFLFAKYANGQMFVGVNTANDAWVMGEVASPQNAWERLHGIDEKAEDFVIIWE